MNSSTKNSFSYIDTEGTPKIVFKNIIPAIITMLMILIYNLADTLFVGMTHDAFMMAAVSLVTPVFTLFSAIGIIFGTGGSSFISRTLGLGDTNKAKKIASFSFWAALIIGIIIGVLILICLNPISFLLGASENTLSYVNDYLSFIGISAPFMILSNAFSHLVRAEGKAKQSMLGSLVGNLINIILDPIMILGFNWGIKGAAIATLIGNAIATFYYCFLYVSGSSSLSISPKYFSMKDGIFTGVMAIGIPASLNNFFMTISNIFANNLMANYNDMAVAGFGVAMKIGMILAMILMGVGIGIQPVLGFCYGAKKYSKFSDILKCSVLISFIISLALTIFTYVFSSGLVSGFIQDPNAFEYGLKFVWIFTLSGPSLGILFVLMNTLQAIGAVLPATIVSISRQGIIYIPLLFIFNLVFKSPEMLTAAQPIADYITLIIAICLYFNSKKFFQKTM